MDQDRRVAVLDVGSNSVRLLVAERRDGFFVPLFTQKITSRLIAGMRDGQLTADALARTGDALARLAGTAREWGATRVLAFGTSAVRDARNRASLLADAEAQGVSFLVLDGETEARLAYAGAAPSGRALVVDIGGGSTEFLAGDGGRVLAAASAPIGAVRLSERLPEARRAECLIDAALQGLEPAWRVVAPQAQGAWIGVGGTVTALSAMTLRLQTYDPDRVQGFALSAAAVRDWLNRLLTLSLPERRALPGLNPERADIIHAGAAILAACFALTGRSEIVASDRDNLLGACALLLDR